MRIKYLSLKETMETLNKFAQDNNLKNEEIIKWVVIKTLRLKRDQFAFIKNVEEYKIDLMKKTILRYIGGESLSQIFGYIEFYGNYFDVTENVFDPRLSTEALVDEILKLNKKFLKTANIIDLCTGSGCIATTLSLKLNNIVDALDISPFALEIAKKNAEKLGAMVNFYQFDLNCDWQKIFTKKYDIIVSNPPYWNVSKILDNSEVVRNNPKIAFDGGEDGLKYIKLIIKNSVNYLNKNGYLFLEIDPEQATKVKQYMLRYGYKNIKIAKDHRNIDRVICGQIN